MKHQPDIYCSEKRKAPHHDSDASNSGHDTEEERISAKRTIVKPGRAPKKNLVMRREKLEADEWMLVTSGRY